MAYLKLFREMWRYAGADRWKIVAFMTMHVLSWMAPVLQPLVFAQILNLLQTRPPQLLLHILHWIAAWIALFLWFNIFHRIARYFEFDIAYRGKQRFLNDYYRIVTELPLSWHSDNHSGETINRINKAADVLARFALSQYELIGYFMKFWGPLIGLTAFSWPIGLVAIAMAVITILVIKQFDGELAGLFGLMNELQHRVSAVLYDYIGNIKTIITLRLGTQTGHELDHRQELGYGPFMRAEAWVDGAKWFTVSLCNLVVEAGIILFYIWRCLSRGQPILAGNVSAVFQYLKQLSGTFADIAGNYQTIINLWVDYQAALPLKQALDELHRIHAESPADWKIVKIADLQFAYAPDKPTLQNITLAFSPGDRIALVGESGSGKSSLMAVLRGLYEPQSVSLTVDGRTYDSLAPLSGITTLIPQEPEIFENTIRYNITFGVEHSEAEIANAIRLARFDPVLERLPNGLETDVRERGVTLSGGERQRLALARGILAAQDSSIVLMDEPTSSVDAFNEAEIYAGLFAAFADKTVIASIHRLHLLSRFTRVIVMHQGRIVQTGSFEDLRNADGPFQVLWRKSGTEE